MGIQWEKIAYNWDIMVIFHGDTGYNGDNQQTSLVGLNGKICGKIIFNLGTLIWGHIWEHQLPLWGCKPQW